MLKSTEIYSRIKCLRRNYSKINTHNGYEHVSRKLVYLLAIT